MEHAEWSPTLPSYKTRDIYRVLKLLSKGSYGDVFLAERIDDGIHVCLKQVDLEFLSPKERLGCLAEVELLRSLPPHPNVVSCFDAFWDDTSDCGGGARLVLVLEYGDAGDLESFVQSAFSQQQTLDLEITLVVFAQILSGLSFLHERRILHRDIKSKNIFRFSNGRVVIGDFGTSKSLAHTTALADTLVGSPLYMSPELLEGHPYSFSSDIWSLGCLLYELLAGQTPFAAPSYPAVVFKITNGTFEPLPVNTPHDIQALVARMLSLDPSKRPTVDEIFEMGIIKNRISKPGVEPGESLEVTLSDDPGTTTAASAGATEISEARTNSGLSSASEGQVILLPPPPPASLVTNTTAGNDLLLPPPPPQMTVKVHPKKRRAYPPVFPTARASIANILSRERLNIHKERVERATQDETRFLSCVPVMERRINHEECKNVQPSSGSKAKQRGHVPPENMLIIGSKIKSIERR